LPVSSSPNFVNNGWFQVNKDSPGNVFAGTGFAEKGVERVITSTDGFVRRHLTVWLDSMFQAVKFPAGVTHLDTGLANVNGDDFSHFC